MTYYSVLGVSESASEEEIKSAYRNMLKAFHPDYFSGNKKIAEQKTQETIQAYDVLKNPSSKASYDALLKKSMREKFEKPLQESYEKKLSLAHNKYTKENAIKWILFVATGFLFFLLVLFIISANSIKAENQSLSSDIQLLQGKVNNLESKLKIAKKQRREAIDNVTFVNHSVAFIVDEDGGVYHAVACHYLRDCDSFFVVGLEYALENGYRPCKTCH